MHPLSFKVLENGRLPEGIKESLKWIFPSFAGKKIRLSIEESKEKRSLDQNSYYRGVVLPHVRKVRFEVGDPVNIDAVHEDLIKSFAPVINAKNMYGKAYTRPMRTHEMSVNEMAQFITAISAVMAQFGSPVPMQEYE